jgi:hypothetical protein
MNKNFAYAESLKGQFIPEAKQDNFGPQKAGLNTPPDIGACTLHNCTYGSNILLSLQK